LVVYETSTGANSVVPKDLADPFQKADVGSGGKLQIRPGEKSEEVDVVDAGLKCTSFNWISTWKTAATSLHNGRASEAYLLKHPEKSDNIHVVT
jgi:hypothetical protein